MGLTTVIVAVANPADLTRSQEVTFMVDSGAVFSVVPRDILWTIGIEPHAVESFFMADGQSIQREIGSAIFFFEGRRGAAPVIFGEENDSALLGVTTLEAFGLVLHPLQRELKPMVLRI